MKNVLLLGFAVFILIQTCSMVVQRKQEPLNKEQNNESRATHQRPHEMYGSELNEGHNEFIEEEKNTSQPADYGQETFFYGHDEYFDPAKHENIIPTLKLNRKKLKMLGKTGYYIREYSGTVFQYVINEQWEGVWVALSPAVRIRIYGEVGVGRWRFAFNGLVLDSGHPYYCCILKRYPRVKILKGMTRHLKWENLTPKLKESELFPKGMKIVVKSVNSDVLKEQNEEEAVKRALQAQTLARKIAYIASQKADSEFGKFPEIIKTWMFRNRDHTWMIEEKLEGFFKKLINNNMAYIEVPEDRLEDQEKAAALAHFSLEFTEGEALITDLQGVGLRWTDVEIATKIINDDRYFGIGNLGKKSHKRFIDEHKCSKFCKFLHLPNLTPRCSRKVPTEKTDEQPKEPLQEDSTSSGFREPRIHKPDGLV